MEMTRQRLEQYRSNVQEIKYLEHKIKDLWRDSDLYGHDTIMDYRSGYGHPRNVFGYDKELEKKCRERYEKKLAELRAEVNAVESFIFSIGNSKTRQIFQLYFLDGLSQEEVAKQVYMDRSGISKKISVYLKVSHKSQKSQV